MPKPLVHVCSFWVWRPDEFPNAVDYPKMLRALQVSCDRLGLRHVVLTDEFTERERFEDVRGMVRFAPLLPMPLMQAATEVQSLWLDSGPPGHTLFVGADAIMKRNPIHHLSKDFDLAVTLRPNHPRYPINNGFQFIPHESAVKVAPVFRMIADRCGVKWCDDQRAIQDVLAPMPDQYGPVVRQGIRVRFLPMRPFNMLPSNIADPATNAVCLHFRGKARKAFFFDWTARHGFAA